MNKQDAIEQGFSEERAELMAQFEQHCEQMYEYETSHVDAADAYSIIWNESDIDTDNIKRFYFDTFHNTKDGEFTVYLGNGEIEIQLPEPLTIAEADYFSRNTDYVVNPSALDLAYTTYPMDLVVRAEYYPEGDE